MKKSKIIFLLLVASSFLNFTSQQRTVYVCGSSNIYHYSTGHNSFGNCTHEVYEMPESKAISLGKRVCRCKY